MSTGRERVKAAIAHRGADRSPYAIDFTREGWEVLRPIAGELTLEQFVDNDVKDFHAPWWRWFNLAADWSGMEPPTSRATVIGTGSYSELIDKLKAARDAGGRAGAKYYLVRIYGSHFEKAYFARGIENLLADMAGAPEFAKRLHNLIIDKNMVMLENMLSLEEIDGVLLGSDWGSQLDLLMRPEVWQEIIRPGEQREYDLVHAYGKDVWVHSCGNVQRIIPSLIEMGLDVLNPVQPEAMDIARLKRDYGAKLTFWGGYQHPTDTPLWHTRRGQG